MYEYYNYIVIAYRYVFIIIIRDSNIQNVKYVALHYCYSKET